MNLVNTILWKFRILIVDILVALHTTTTQKGR